MVIRYQYKFYELFLICMGLEIKFHSVITWETDVPFPIEWLEIAADRGYVMNVQVKEVYK